MGARIVNGRQKAGVAYGLLREALQDLIDCREEAVVDRDADAVATYAADAATVQAAVDVLHEHFGGDAP